MRLTYLVSRCFSAYHAGLNNKVRTSVLDNWISSKIQVVVATVAFGYDCLLNSTVMVLIVKLHLTKFILIWVLCFKLTLQAGHFSPRMSLFRLLVF